MNMEFIGKLPIPQEIKKQYPVSEKAKETKALLDAELKNIFVGKDNKTVLIIGPCSADREDSVFEYLSRLYKVREKVKDKIFIVPRVYTNKPRSTGEGYKGMLHYPNPDEKPDLIKGVIATRKLHMKVLSDYEFVSADEMLYPENHRYINDLLGYVSVGARSVENQQHRLTASGLYIPVGMKNPTSGNLETMMNSVFAATHPHTFCYRGWEVKSKGNPLSHAILRGYIDNSGNHIPNFNSESIEYISHFCENAEIPNPAVIIDTNHSNSGKNPYLQPEIIKSVLKEAVGNTIIKKVLKGFMVESYLEDGACSIDEHIYGKSITDACLGWDKTERLIYEIADML